MPGKNGGSDDEFDGQVTPNETPQATLAIHRPYVMALANCISPLHEAVETLREVLHELRVAEEPMTKRLRQNLSDAGREIKGVGQKIEEQFAK